MLPTMSTSVFKWKCIFEHNLFTQYRHGRLYFDLLTNFLLPHHMSFTCFHLIRETILWDCLRERLTAENGEKVINFRFLSLKKAGPQSNERNSRFAKHTHTQSPRHDR